jgi:hypothetical protein
VQMDVRVGIIQYIVSNASRIAEWQAYHPRILCKGTAQTVFTTQDISFYSTEVSADKISIPISEGMLTRLPILDPNARVKASRMSEWRRSLPFLSAHQGRRCVSRYDQMASGKLDRKGSSSALKRGRACLEAPVLPSSP